MAKAADIVVNLLTRTASFDRGMSRSQRRLNKFSKTSSAASKALRTFGTVLGAVGVGAGVGGFAAMVKSTIEANDELAKTATTLGIATNELKALQLAAKLAGVEQAALSKGLTKQRKAVVDAANGMATYQRHFDRLGLSTEELLKLSPIDQFKAIGRAMGGLSSQTERIGVLYDIFGGRNVRLLGLLTNVEASLGFATERTQAFGTALSDVDAAAFEVANDQFALMGEAVAGIKNQLSFKVLPAILLFSNYVQAAAVEAGGFNNEMSATEYSVIQTLGGLVSIWRTLKAVGLTIAAVGLGVVNALLAPVEALESKLRAIINFAPDLFGLDPLVGADTFTESLRASIGGVKQSFDDVILSYQGIIGESDAFIASWIKAREEVAKISGDTAKNREQLRSEAAELLDFLNKQKDSEASSAESLKTQATLARIVAGTRSQEEKLVENLAIVNAAIATGEGEINELLKAQAVIREQILQGRIKESEVASIIASTKTQEENIVAKLATVNAALASGEGNINELLVAQGRLRDQLLESRSDESQLTQFGIQAAHNLQDAFAEFFHFTDNGFKGLLQNFINLLQDMVAELLARQVLLSFFGALKGFGGGVGDFAGAVTGAVGKAANGAQARANQPFIVGERGPELFVPNVAGSIVPNSKLNPMTPAMAGGGMNFSITNNINIDSRTDREQMRAELGPVIERSVELSIGRVRQLSRQGKLL